MMTKSEAGRLGGKATFNRHGRDHMSAIGKKGFAAIATFARGGRRAALARLAGKGKMTMFHPGAEFTEKDFEALYVAIEAGNEDIPF